MEHRLRRQQLHELVWSEPIATVALRFGVSGVALGKIRRRHGIPTPSRGHWAKLKAGKPSPSAPLPLRPLGIPETIYIGHTVWTEQKEEDKRLVGEDVPPPPEFTESLDDLEERVRKLVGRVPRTRALSSPHPLISKLIKGDEERLEAWTRSSYPSLYDQPFFISPYEQRRLRIIDSVFKAASHLGMKPTIGSRKNPSDFGVRVGETTIWFSVGKPGEERLTWRATSEARRPAFEETSIKIKQHIEGLEGLRTEWRDTPEAPLEASLPQIVINLIVAAEMQVRHAERQQYKYRVERRARLIQAEKERQERAELEALEQQRRLERARVDKLFGDSMSFRLARDIRKYVSEVIARNAEDPHPVPAADMAEWERWAMAEADRIDPVISKAFLAPAPEIEESRVGASRESKPEPAQQSPELEAWHPNRWYTRLHR